MCGSVVIHAIGRGDSRLRHPDFEEWQRKRIHPLVNIIAEISAFLLIVGLALAGVPHGAGEWIALWCVPQFVVTAITSCFEEKRLARHDRWYALVKTELASELRDGGDAAAALAANGLSAELLACGPATQRPARASRMPCLMQMWYQRPVPGPTVTVGVLPAVRGVAVGEGDGDPSEVPVGTLVLPSPLS